MAWTAPSASVAMMYEQCCKCGIVFSMPHDFYKNCRERKNGQKEFFCPRGHEQHYLAETSEQRLQRKLEAAESREQFARKRAELNERRRRAAVGQLTKVKNRVKKGVCPFCNRHFENIQRHMESKHKEAQAG